MGLDMEAVRRVSVRNWGLAAPQERTAVQIECNGKPISGIKSERISVIEESVMTWRKANHIHAWFVDNVQNGEDDCKTYHVGWDSLRDLLAVCEKVLRASELVDGMVYAGKVYDRKHPRGRVRREPGKVIKDATVAQALLPTREGFFFGNCEYDEGYLGDVRATRDWIVGMLAERAAGTPGGIYYSSSW